MHAANAALLLLLLVLAALTGSRARATAVAALWAVHPLNVEAAAWCGGRGDLLMLLFGLLALLVWLGRLRRTGRGLSPAAAGLFVLAALSKSLIATLPLLLLLLDFGPLGRLRSPAWRCPGARAAGYFGAGTVATLIREKTALLLVAAAVATVSLLLAAGAPQTTSLGPRPGDRPDRQRRGARRHLPADDCVARGARLFLPAPLGRLSRLAVGRRRGFADCRQPRGAAAGPARANARDRMVLAAVQLREALRLDAGNQEAQELLRASQRP